ncbi:tyrosine-type recombinase/integrase [Crenobacter caeni]|uniref:Integrase family protein n=1 Tax=Crenobacter caeni TaxID=2705474 RepID=A0A6B2KNA5_9NEIS|nr:integrase family protein [Crenobacter caeni]NDV11638.1 integrase family protein [Crenobacter caeni]
MFDARAAKLLAAGEYLTSPDHPGLRLEARASGRTWTYRYRSPVDGRLRQVKIGQWPAMSISAAIVEWERLREAREQGVDLAEARKEARLAARHAAQARRARQAERPYSVFDACHDYWAGHVRPVRQKKGADEVWRMFDTMIPPDLAVLPAAELTRAQAFDLIQSVSTRAPVQAAKLRAELGAAWDYALDAGRLPDTSPNWWRMILRGKVRSRGRLVQGERTGTTKRVLTPDEIGQLIRWLPNFTRLVEDVLTLYLWTGARGAEVVQMEGREIVREGDVLWWVLPKAKTKNARHERATDLRVPLFGRGQAVVLRRKALYGDGYLFPARLQGGRVEPVQQKTIQTSVWYHQPYSQTRSVEVRPRLPVTHWAPHDLRRTVRTRLAALGCPEAVAESILGHLLPGVVGVYNQHSYDAERVEWLMRLSDHLESLAAADAL